MYATILTVLIIVVGQVRFEERWAKYDEEVAVPQTVWTNALADGDFNAAGNWSNGVPSSGNTPAIFDGTSKTSPTQNLDRTGGTSFELRVAPEYGKTDIGASGSPLILISNAGALSATLRHSGTTYLTIDGNFASDIIVDDGVVYLNATNAAQIAVLALRFQANVTVLATANMGGVCFVTGSQCRLTIAEKDAAEAPPGKFIVQGGIVTNHRTYTATAYIVLTGGTFIQTAVLDALVDVIVTDGHFRYESANDPSGESFSIFAPGGYFDAQASSGTLEPGDVIVGPHGVLAGSIASSGVGMMKYNLNDPWPGS